MTKRYNSSRKGGCSMNPIYEQMKQKEAYEVTDAVHKYVEAVNAFQKLNPNQKEIFFQNVVLQKYLSKIICDDQYKQLRK